MLAEMKLRNIPVTLGADAHVAERVSDGYEDAMLLLQQCGYTHVNYFLNRERQEVAIKDALPSLMPLQAPVKVQSSQAGESWHPCLVIAFACKDHCGMVVNFFV